MEIDKENMSTNIKGEMGSKSTKKGKLAEDPRFGVVSFVGKSSTCTTRVMGSGRENLECIKVLLLEKSHLYL